MVVTDTISDMLTTIRNGILLSKEFVCTPSSKLKLNVLKVLQEEGYITSFKENEIQKGIKEIKAEKETFLGINFHYLRPKWRAVLLDRVTAKIGGGLPKWSKLRQIRQIAPTIKRYRYDHIMRKVIPIEEDEQEIETGAA